MARRYKYYFRVVKTIFYELAQQVSAASFQLEKIIFIFEPACNVLFIVWTKVVLFIIWTKVVLFINYGQNINLPRLIQIDLNILERLTNHEVLSFLHFRSRLKHPIVSI